jgi:hypothetical protein
LNDLKSIRFKLLEEKQSRIGDRARKIIGRKTEQNRRQGKMAEEKFSLFDPVNERKKYSEERKRGRALETLKKRGS